MNIGIDFSGLPEWLFIPILACTYITILQIVAWIQKIDLSSGPASLPGGFFIVLCLSAMFVDEWRIMALMVLLGVMVATSSINLMAGIEAKQRRASKESGKGE